MKSLQLLPISPEGKISAPTPLTKQVEDICKMTASWYEKVGYTPPWIGYLGLMDAQCVVVGGFKTPPQNNRVEIAYGTMDGYEGRGMATQMVGELIRLARQTIPGIMVTAQTLPEKNASGTILSKFGFECVGPVDHEEDGIVWQWELVPKRSLEIGEELEVK